MDILIIFICAVIRLGQDQVQNKVKKIGENFSEASKIQKCRIILKMPERHTSTSEET